MNDRVVIRRLPTGVAGIDALLGGGMAEFSVRFVNLSDGVLTGELDRVLARIVDEVERVEPGLACPCLYDIDAGGLVIDAPRPEVEALLTGRPRISPPIERMAEVAHR